MPLVDPRDAEQVEALFRLMRAVPEVIEHYLDKHVFPETARHQGMKLSATGQELGGDLLFPRRLGFSGTPADLLPLELGAPKFETGTDAKVLATLADPDVVTTRFLADDWDVESLLRAVAVADPPARALIDVGALVTGMSNQSVARFLLDNGLAWAEGCVYLDEEDRQMVLMRVSEATSEEQEQEQEQEQSSETNKASSEEKDVRENARGRARAKKKYDAVPLSRVAALDPSRRFTFYDQVHTTGMDIRQAPARAPP